MNLVGAVFWLVVAAVLFAGGDPRFNLHLGIPPSGGWVALLLVLYNLARWWSIRSYRRQRQAEQEALAARILRHRAERHDPAQPPDPNFDFGEPPAGPDAGGRPG